MVLSILLPTYNRSKDLNKNLKNISDQIRSLDLYNKVEIIISNNCSTDDTAIVCSKYIESNRDIRIQYYLQEKNLGIELNSIFTLSKSTAEYILFLGDDDFFSIEYLYCVMDTICSNKQIGCIISSWQGIYSDGSLASAKRDIELPNRVFKAGVKAVIETGWRAHQLSGVVIKREGLYETYISQKVHTIYPHIYLASVAMLRYDTLLCTKYPILVTQPGQECKDWNYGKDGLINYKLEGYKCLPTNYLNRNWIQIFCIMRERNMITKYANSSMKDYVVLVKEILFGEHILLFARFFFLLYSLYLIFRGVFRIIKR